MTIFRRLRDIIPSRGAKRVRVVTDSTADLPAEMAVEHDITVVPLQVIFGEESFSDGIDLTSEEFFRKLEASEELPRTSQPSAGDFQAVYDRLAAQTDQILSIHLSSGFSGTVEAARQAARAIGDRCRIEVIDSGSVSMALGLAAVAAARAARNGEDLDACADRARSVLRRERIGVALDTLEYLRRGGRIGRAASFLGSLLRLKPVLTIRDGEAFPLARVRSRPKALQEVLRICLEDGVPEEAVVIQATTPDDAAFIEKELKARHPGLVVHNCRFGPVLGVHGGPGIIGLCVVLADEAERS